MIRQVMWEVYKIAVHLSHILFNTYIFKVIVVVSRSVAYLFPKNQLYLHSAIRDVIQLKVITESRVFILKA